MKTEKELREIFEKNSDFIFGREESLKKKVSKLEGRLFELIMSEFVSKLDIESGVIKQSKRNLNLTTTIKKIFDNFNKKFNSVALIGLVDDVQESMSLTDTYFQTFTTKSNMERISKKSKGIVLSSLGVDSNGKLIKDGFIDGFINDQTVKNAVAQAAQRNIVSRTKLSDFRKDLKTIIRGAPEAEGGLLARHYRTYAYDAYAQTDRAYNDLIAVELELQGFRYAGGKIKTTRDFCCQRNNLYFTRSEAEKWKGLNFQGKNSGYVPLKDLGGYNCRHRTRWVSNTVMLRNRPDLTERDGKLIKKKGESTQKLNPIKSKK